MQIAHVTTLHNSLQLIARVEARTLIFALQVKRSTLYLCPSTLSHDDRTYLYYPLILHSARE